MDTFELNTKSLCQWIDKGIIEEVLNNGNPYANMVLHDWRKTNSPFWNYWGQMIFNPYNKLKTPDSFKNYFLPLGENFSRHGRLQCTK